MKLTEFYTDGPLTEAVRPYSIKTGETKKIKNPYFGMEFEPEFLDDDIYFEFSFDYSPFKSLETDELYKLEDVPVQAQERDLNVDFDTGVVTVLGWRFIGEDGEYYVQDNEDMAFALLIKDSGKELELTDANGKTIHTDTTSKGMAKFMRAAAKSGDIPALVTRQPE